LVKRCSYVDPLANVSLEEVDVTVPKFLNIPLTVVIVFVLAVNALLLVNVPFTTSLVRLESAPAVKRIVPLFIMEPEDAIVKSEFVLAAGLLIVSVIPEFTTNVPVTLSIVVEVLMLLRIVIVVPSDPVGAEEAIHVEPLNFSQLDAPVQAEVPDKLV
jgi:hypothetical protein